MNVTVLGLGNVLMGDDGFGPLVVQLLDAGSALPPGVTLLEGTPGSDLVPHLLGADALIVVDTVKSAGVPGELRRYDRTRILSAPLLPRINPHQPGLQETLLTLGMLDRGPAEVLLVGVVPERIETGTGVSPALRRAAPVALEMVLAELARLGRPALPRPVPATPDLWWEPLPPQAA